VSLKFTDVSVVSTSTTLYGAISQKLWPSYSPPWEPEILQKNSWIPYSSLLTNILRRMNRKRKLHSEELHNLCCSSSIIRMIKSRRKRWVGYVARTVRQDRFTQSLLWSLAGRHGHKWEDNIKVNVTKIWWEQVAWINLVHDTEEWRDAVNAVINFEFQERRGISRLAERLSAFQEGLPSMELGVTLVLVHESWNTYTKWWHYLPRDRLLFACVTALNNAV
jgi:hypothetical protein